jgi:ribosomal-protein-alanine N-acetyltransferase
LLAAIDASVNLNPWSERQFVGACSPDTVTQASAMVVEVDGRVIGFVVYSLVLDEASVYSIGVVPAYQEKGFGHLLLDTVLVKTKEAGASRCLLEVRQSNTIARRFYERHGFTLDGVRKNYYPTKSGREDALLMSRCLVRKTT